MVHGIYAKTTINEPTFDIVWEEIKPFLENQIVVAHNVSFDRSVLEESLKLYDIISLEILWLCTFELTGMNLENACELYDVELLNHHNALDDALACGNLFVKLLSGYKPKGYEYIHHEKRESFHEKISKEFYKPDLESCDQDSVFYNKHIVISGVFKNCSRNEMAKKLHESGAFIQTNVNHKTDFVLAGANMGPAKKQKAESLGIPIISEEDFEKMIEPE
jgi:DNA polymerase-3 subunit epsilon